jgi:3-isopropylmalate dehydrogenase
MEKANVMESGILWRDVVQEIHDAEYPDVELSHMYADAGAMQLTRWPKQFDVIVTDNLFGDLLSDLAAMLTGSLGMLPSASWARRWPMAGPRRSTSRSMARPRHRGSGQGQPDRLYPQLRHGAALFLRPRRRGDRLEAAVEAVLADGLRTADLLGEEGMTPVSTEQMGDAIVAPRRSRSASACPGACGSKPVTAKPGNLAQARSGGWRTRPDRGTPQPSWATRTYACALCNSAPHRNRSPAM